MFNDDITQRDLQQKLAGTMIMYEGNLFRVLDIDENRNIEGYKVEDNTRYRAKFNSNKFNFAGFPLGYVNHQGKAWYLQRQPRRYYKLGLDGRSLCVKGLPERQRAPIEDLINLPLIHCVKNTYPSFEDSLKTLTSEKVHSIAFDRALAVGINKQGLRHISYKGIKVGWISDNSSINLGLKQQHLKEMLQSKGLKL